METLPHTSKNIIELEEEFSQFRKNIIGSDCTFQTNYGEQEMLYADWIASGRLYRPIENIICDKIGPMMANTHSFSSESGKATTHAYHEARKIIKNHVNAGQEDILVTTGTGMTAALAKLQRIMGLIRPDLDKSKIAEKDRPVVFISHMEHHSNHVPWLETIADVEVLPPGDQVLIDPSILDKKLEQYKNRNLKIGSFTACSNVTGITTPYNELAKIMHAHDGYCFIDFAASAPYVAIDMHPENETEMLDAIFFSPHKFLGGPGSCGVLIFNSSLYRSTIPDNPGGGNVKWTNPWGGYKYSDEPEVREDGGTPGITQVIRAALAIRLKEKMNPERIRQRENEVLNLFYSETENIPEMNLYGSREVKRIGCVSFNVEGLHYNLVVRLLNDRFGIQVRGGWSCASTYAHYLMDISKDVSNEISTGISDKNLSNKPGWVRVSLHPTITNKEVLFIIEALKAIIKNQEKWAADYRYNPETNEFDSIVESKIDQPDPKSIFEF